MKRRKERKALVAMRTMKLCSLDEKTTSRLLDDYRTCSQAERLTDIDFYMKHRFNGLSTVEIAEIEHVSRFTVYRRVRRVNEYLMKYTNP